MINPKVLEIISLQNVISFNYPLSLYVKEICEEEKNKQVKRAI